MYFETTEQENFFDKYIRLMYGTSDNPPFIELTKMKRENGDLYEKCRGYKSIVDSYVERANMRDGAKLRITKDNFKSLLNSALMVNRLGKR